MSFEDNYIHSSGPGQEGWSALHEKVDASSSCVLDVAGTWTEKNPHSGSWRYGLRKKWDKLSTVLSHFLRERILSFVFLVGFFMWSLVIPKEKKGKSLSSYFHEQTGRLAKRSLDVFGAVIGLVLSSPLFLVIAILIKLDSPGPIIFKQERVGQNRRGKHRRQFSLEISAEERRNGDRRETNGFGEPFKVYKFRTMVDNAERTCGPVWAKKDDPRITSVGRILRHTRIDELPQMVNVLRGEMSLVGPRPERYFFVKSLADSVEHYPRRLSVKPGITGLAQVKNGYDSDMDDVKSKIVYDLDYIRNWSILKDLRILAQTVVVVVTGRGAF